MTSTRCFALTLVLAVFWGSAAVSETSGSQFKGDVMATLTIRVGDTDFTAVLYDNESVRALLPRLPLTLTLSELNGNEKYVTLPQDLPSKANPVERIRTGDLMLYGEDCLVLFYDNFSTRYRYTSLGHVENSTGLAAALGSGSVRVTFAVADP